MNNVDDQQDAADRIKSEVDMLQMRNGFFMLGYSLLFGFFIAIAWVLAGIRDGHLSKWDYFLSSRTSLVVLLALYGLYKIFRYRPR